MRVRAARARGRSTSTPLVAVTAMALALAGCASPATSDGPGSPGPGPVAPGDGPDEPSAPGAPLLQVAHVGGFAPVGHDFAVVPELTVYADGLAITHGPTTLEYPGALLPNLLTHELEPAAVEDLLGAASDAGLLGTTVDYGMPPIADAGATQLTIHVDGATSVHRAEALDLTVDPRSEGGFGATGLSAEEVEAREVLAAFIDEVRTAIDEAGESGTYRPASYAVMARPATDAATGDDVAPATLDWPLEVPLTDATCVVVEGAEAEVLGEVLDGARQGDRFEQDGVLHDLWVRVLLPGEVGCSEPGRAPAG